jgi:hypothetical protein
MHEQDILHGYLLSRGMHPKRAHHVASMAGGGVLDFFKKHKKTILKGLAGLATTAVGAYAGHKLYDRTKDRNREVNALYDAFIQKESRGGMEGGMRSNKSNKRVLNGAGFFDWFDRHKVAIYKALSHAGKIGKYVYDKIARGSNKVGYIDV